MPMKYINFKSLIAEILIICAEVKDINKGDRLIRQTQIIPLPNNHFKHFDEIL